MTAKINQKITGVYVKPKADDAADAIEQMHEKFERPEMLTGSTYKIKTPLSDHALYITINDVILNAGLPVIKYRSDLIDRYQKITIFLFNDVMMKSIP